MPILSPGLRTLAPAMEESIAVRQQRHDSCDMFADPQPLPVCLPACLPACLAACLPAGLLACPCPACPRPCFQFSKHGVCQEGSDCSFCHLHDSTTSAARRTRMPHLPYICLPVVHVTAGVRARPPRRAKIDFALYVCVGFSIAISENEFFGGPSRSKWQCCSQRIFCHVAQCAHVTWKADAPLLQGRDIRILARRACHCRQACEAALLGEDRFCEHFLDTW